VHREEERKKDKPARDPFFFFLPLFDRSIAAVGRFFLSHLEKKKLSPPPKKKQTDGVLRCTPSGVVWRKAGGSGGGGPGASVEVPAAEIASLSWTRTPRGGALTVCRRAAAAPAAAAENGASDGGPKAAVPPPARAAPSPQFVGVSSSSLEAVRALASASWNGAAVEEVPSATRGASWGALALCENGDLSFSTEGVNAAASASDAAAAAPSAGTGGGLAFRLPLADVSTVQLGKEEVGVFFFFFEK